MSAKSNSRLQSRPRLRRRRLALALAMALLAPSAWAGVVPACSTCLPEVGNVAAGAATSSLDVGGVMNPGATTEDIITITQTTSSAIINWESFNVAAGFTVDFIQPDVNSVTLNRVIGDMSGYITPSIIDGTITANGSVFLVNPMGILFGKGSQVNVGGLVASTLDITDADFLSGAAMADPHYVFNAGNPYVGYAIVNRGTLSTIAGSQGTIALLAARIENQAGATISAPGGSVVFGAASGVNLDFYNDGLTTVTLTGNGQPLDFYCATSPVPTSSCLGGIESIGDIAAIGGHVEMRTQTQDGSPQPIGTGLFTEPSNGGRIWIGGKIDARASATNVGSIILDAGQGNVDIGGVSGQTAWINVDSTAAGQDAGTILVRGNQIFTYLCVGPGGVCSANDSLGWLDATAYGAGANGGTITLDAGSLFYHAGVLQAAAVSGAGGTIQINAADAQIYNWITAEGLGGNGGTIGITASSILLHRGQIPWLGGPGILYSQAVLSAYGSTNGGTVNLTGDLAVVDLGDVTPADPEYKSVINVRGMSGNGGSVDVQGGTTIDIGTTWFVNADGTANGGTIDMSAMYLYVQGDMTANGDVTGGSMDLYAYYMLDVSGNLTANGDVDGGSITLDGASDVSVSGQLTANGGMTPDPADGIGNGGTINVTGYDLDVSGSLIARGGSQQYIDPDNSSLNRYSFGGQVFVYGNTVNLSGLFDTTALNAWGTVQTDAYLYLFAAATTDVTSGAWFIDSNSVWVTTAAGASAYGFGAVLVDQTLAQSLENGTQIYLSADNTVFDTSGSGEVRIDPGVSITSYSGSLSLRGRNGIFGSGFSMSTGWGVYLDANGSSIQLDNFSMDGGSVEMRGGDISLDSFTLSGGDARLYGDGISMTYGHIYTFGGGFSATAYSGGIGLYSTWIDDSGGGDIHLDASGSSSGIDAQWVYIDTDGGDITFEASNSTGGIAISNSEIGIAASAGAITLLADNSSSGIVIDASKIQSGASMLIQATNGSGVDINSSILSSSGDYLHIDATGSGGIYIDGSAVDSGAGSLTLDADYSGAIRIENASRIESNGGQIQMFANHSSTGISIYYDSVVYSNGGDIAMHAVGGPDEGGIWIAYNAVVDSGDGAILMDVAGGSTGIRVDGSSIRADGGDITLDAGNNGSGIHVYTSTIHSQSGAVELLAQQSDGGISVYNSSILADGGAITLDADDSYSGGIAIYGALIAGGAGVTLSAQRSYRGILVDGSQLTSNGGDIALTADGDVFGDSPSIVISNSQIDSGGGDVRMATGTAGHGIEIDRSTVDSGGGAIALYASDTDYAIYIHGQSVLDSGGGDITMVADDSDYGIRISDSSIYGGGGAIAMSANGDDTDFGILLSNSSLVDSGGGAVSMTADGTDNGVGLDDAAIVSAGGDVTLRAEGSRNGVWLQNGASVDSGIGNLTMDGDDSYFGVGVRDSTIDAGGDILMSADNSYGILIVYSSIDSHGGNIAMHADASGDYGVWVYGSSVLSEGGDIVMNANGSDNGIQVELSSLVDSGSGNITLDANGGYGGIGIDSSSLTSGGGDIAMNASNSDGGIGFTSATVASGGGNIALLADGTGSGIRMTDSDLTSSGGTIEIGGRSDSGAGVTLDADSSVDAGAGMVIVRAANDGSSDAIVLHGSITSTTAVNLRPLDDAGSIFLGGGSGFVLDNAELANIHAPWLVIGSAQHQGAIQVVGNIAYGGNLALQNQGSSAGIHLGAALDVSGYTLGLFTGGSIDQTSAGAIRATSLVAMAQNDVLLAAAQNDVTGTTLAGSAGGHFEYLDVNGLAIGNVSAFGFDPNGGGLVAQGSSGVSASNVLIQTQSGNLTLNADVQGAEIDLVVAGVFLNPGGHSLLASGSWRVWASTWIGEDRGGLVGSGPLPNLYNCTYAGPCGVTVVSGNHFIYTQQPSLSVYIDDASREYGDDNPVFSYDVSGLILGDDAASVLGGAAVTAANSGSDVGDYAITNGFFSAAGYALSVMPGTLSITPATLLFTADPLTWYMGMPFPDFTGTVTGFKNGDTLDSVFGPDGGWFTNATPLSIPGYYGIYGAGNPRNYVIAQAPGNEAALHILPLSQSSDTPFEFISDPVETYVYERNFETTQTCPVGFAESDQALAGGDPLGNEWSKVRRRLNLVNCFNDNRRNGCGSF